MLREINSTCRNLNEAAVTLIESKPEDKSSADYQLRISATIETSDRESIIKILQKNNLSFKEEAGALTIYKSKNFA